MSRALLRSMLELRQPTTGRLPPSFLLPLRSRSFNTTHANIDPIPEDAPSQSSTQNTKAPQTSPSQSAPATRTPSLPSKAPEPLRTPIVDSVRQLLPVLRSQPEHFVTIHVHGRPYLVTEGDEVRLPFRMPGVVPGDVLRLNRALTIASRDLTLRGAPYVDERLFECRATVLAHEAAPMRVKTKTKRRNRKVKTVRSKQRYTILRVSELKIKGPEELDD